MGRGVILLSNQSKSDVLAALDEVRSLITAHGRLVADLDATNTPLEHLPGADLIVVLGGDGTLLAQSRRCVALGLPMLGVNLGKLGFMAEFDIAALRAHAAALFGTTPLVLQDRPLLQVSVHRSSRTAWSGLALNDAVITAGPPFRMISLSLSIDGAEGPSVMGDGLIIATPTGSTAYNVSAGGAIVSPDVDAMAITPIAAHSLAFRPIVVAGNSSVHVTLNSVNADVRLERLADHLPTGVRDASLVGAGTSLVLDGQSSFRLERNDRVQVRKHPTPIRFVRNTAGNYWATLIEKMHWAAPPKVRAS
jgi:NAD+ kinase